MSNNLDPRSLFVGNHLCIAFEGQTIPSTGQRVDKFNIPSMDVLDADLWQKPGDINDVSLNPELEEVELKIPDPVIMKVADQVITSYKHVYAFVLNTLSLAALEVVFGTKIDPVTGIGKLGSRPTPKVWAVWQAVDPQLQKRIIVNCWGVFRQDGGTKFGDNDFTKPTFYLSELESPLNKVQLI